MLEHEDFPPWWYLRLAFVWNATRGERDRVLAEEERVYHTVSLPFLLLLHTSGMCSSEKWVGD